MEDVYIQSIKVKKVRNVVDFDIPIDHDTKKNLLITGKNGSGKTSLLNELTKYLSTLIYKNEDHEVVSKRINDQKIYSEQLIIHKTNNPGKTALADFQIREFESWLSEFGGTEIKFNNSSLINEYFKKGDFIIALFGAKRDTTLKTPTGVNKLDLKQFYNIEEKAGDNFIQYLVNLKADRSFAKDDSDLETVIKVDEWFKQLEDNLLDLFESSGFKLEFDRKSYNFNIIENGKEPYNLNQLSGGFSAIFNIITELIMRMEEHRTKSYDVQGIVLIDEIETHLHIELQKKILPFLTSFFPKIQFIVTTHSPFILSSIENAAICDLEKRIVTMDLSGYSYDTLIESYFNSDKYSFILKKNIEKYEELLDKKDNINVGEKDMLFHLKRYLNDIPKFISDELAVKIQQIKLKERNRQKDDILT